MDPIAKTVTIIFLVTTMLSIGLKVSAGELLSSIRDRGRMTRLLVLNFLLIPAIGMLLITIFPMSLDAKVGFLLLAVAPGGLNAIQFTSKTTKGLSYAATSLFILSFLSILVSPLLATFLIPLETTMWLPYGKAIAWLLFGVLGPMLIGMAVHHQWSGIAHKMAKPVAIIGTVSFVIVVVLLWGMRKQAKAGMGTSELLAMLIFIIATMVVGWVLGGPGKEMRRIMATGSSMRNVALGFMIASSCFPNTNVDETVIAFGALMIPMNMIFTIYEVIQCRRSKQQVGTDVAKPAARDAR